MTAGLVWLVLALSLAAGYCFGRAHHARRIRPYVERLEARAIELHQQLELERSQIPWHDSPPPPRTMGGFVGPVPPADLGAGERPLAERRREYIEQRLAQQEGLRSDD